MSAPAPYVHAPGCTSAVDSHPGACPTAISESMDDSLATPITEQTRAHRDAPDMVDHPPHYGGRDDQYEAIKVIEAWGLGFCLGNTVKYISRAGKKGDALEDLKKARWYLDRQIGQMEKTVSA